MSRFDYTWSCDCFNDGGHLSGQGTTATLNEARKEAREHLKTHTDKDPNWQVFIDQYDHREGELSDRYWKIVKGK